MAKIILMLILEYGSIHYDTRIKSREIKRRHKKQLGFAFHMHYHLQYSRTSLIHSQSIYRVYTCERAALFRSCGGVRQRWFWVAPKNNILKLVVKHLLKTCAQKHNQNLASLHMCKGITDHCIRTPLRKKKKKWLVASEHLKDSVQDFVANATSRHTSNCTQKITCLTCMYWGLEVHCLLKRTYICYSGVWTDAKPGYKLCAMLLCYLPTEHTPQRWCG